MRPIRIRLQVIAAIAALSASPLASAGEMELAVPAVETIHHSGPSAVKADILIVGDGFTAAEMPLFATRAQAAVDSLFRREPFISRRGDYNIHRVNAISKDSGISDWTQGIQRNTAFRSYYYMEARTRIWFNDDFDRNLEKAIQMAPGADVVLIIANGSTSAGSGRLYVPEIAPQFDAFPRVCIASGAFPGELAVHELGHSFAGLQDEYVEFLSAFPSFWGEPWAPNVSLNGDPTTVKWSRWIGQDRIGVYQGACRYAYGIYRPREYGCCMRTSSLGFCLVCREDGILPRTRQLAPTLRSISILPSPSAKLSLDDEARLLAFGNYDDLQLIPIEPAWTSLNPDVATVSPDGTLSLHSPGTVTISAALEGVVQTLQIYVSPPTPAPKATIVPAGPVIDWD